MGIRKVQENMLGWWCKSARYQVPRIPSEVLHRGLNLRLLIPDILCQNSRMRNLTATICLTLAVLLGSAG